MKRILFALLVFVFVFLAACSGGGKPVPVDPPKDPETIIPNPEGKDCWKKYVHQDSRHEYVTIYDQDKERTAFTIYWDNHLYTENSLGKATTTARRYRPHSNMMNQQICQKQQLYITITMYKIHTLFLMVISIILSVMFVR